MTGKLFENSEILRWEGISSPSSSELTVQNKTAIL